MVYASAAAVATGLATGCFSSNAVDDTAQPVADAGADSTIPDAVEEPDAVSPALPEAAPEGSVDATLDASPEASIEAGRDAGTPDAPTEAQTTCGPGEAGVVVVPPYGHAIPADTYYCDAGIGAIAAACLGDAASYSACTASLGALDPTCAGCLLTNDAGSAGSLVGAGLPSVNLAGCIALDDRSDAGQACAYAVQDAWACTQAACPCPVTDDPSARALKACMAAAATGVCSVSTQAANACLAAESADGAAPDCPVGVPADQQFLTLAAFFCKS